MDQQLPKPADLLMHYNYGAAAVKHWGKNISVLTDRPGIPRSVPVPAPMPVGPTSQGEQGAGSVRTRSEGEVADLEAQDRWDEDDVMLFFWGNSKGALERHARKEQERTLYLEDWRAAVTGNPERV